MFQDKLAKFPFLTPEKLGLFLVLALFFHPSFPNIGHSYPVKNYFSEQVMAKSHEKDLVTEWLPW